jgi:hypothetical protein
MLSSEKRPLSKLCLTLWHHFGGRWRGAGADHTGRHGQRDRNWIVHRGKDLTREGLIQGIESLHNFDIGLGPQLKLDYSAKDHKGFDRVIPTVVRGGRAVPFSDWTIAAPK